MSLDKYEPSDISRVEVVAHAKIRSFVVMECVLVDINGHAIDLKYIKSSELKEKGVIKRHDATQKAERWLNTQEGREWVFHAIDYKSELLKKIKDMYA
ncbi:hypothetical protein ACQR3P_28810 [Rhodococcus sp. IEGM1300]